MKYNIVLYLKIRHDKSSELQMTHQTTANRWPLSAHMVNGVAAPRVKIMTTYSAVAWWVNLQY